MQSFLRILSILSIIPLFSHFPLSKYPCFNTFLKLLYVRLVNAFSDIISPTLFYQLLLCAINLALLMFGIDTKDTADFDTLVLILATFCLLPPTFFYCHQSENITTNLLSVTDSFYNYAWYQLPVQHQQYFRLPIQRSQTAFRLSGYGIVDCSLERFASVCLNEEIPQQFILKNIFSVFSF